jgi:hypothetical protein
MKRNLLNFTRGSQLLGLQPGSKARSLSPLS